MVSFQEEKLNKRGNLGVIILLSVILIVIVIVVVLYVYSKPDNRMLINVSENISYYDIYVASNALTPINYVLSNDTTVLIRGTLHDPLIVEEFKHIEANSSLTLSGWGVDYYFNSTVCNVAVNNTRCFLGVDRKALGYALSLESSYTLFVSVSNVSGKIQDPLLCFSWKTNVADVWTNFKSVPVPSVMRFLVDKCYETGDIYTNAFIPFEVHRNFAFNTSMPLAAFMIDKEAPGHDDGIIGMRNASIVI